MVQDMKKEVKDWEDEDEVRDYLKKLLHKEAFDRRGLIYGMGHAVYSCLLYTSHDKLPVCAGGSYRGRKEQSE